MAKIQTATYDFNRDEYPYLGLSGGRQYGLLAQNLEKVMPEMVTNVKQPLFNDKEEKIDELEARLKKLEGKCKFL